MDIIETPIEGLQIKLNKVVGDNRGYLAELSPNGTDNVFFSDGIRNMYISVATQKGVARAGHYHHKLIENFYTLSGVALWIFKDFRKDKKSFGNIYPVILGENDRDINVKDVEAYLVPKNMAHVFVPAGIYHLFYPLTDKEVRVLSIASLSHDDNDYVRIAPSQDKDVEKVAGKILSELRI
jgi:dTDP-4-dehydrorhamnose 3,5-epimerase-like enzyme